MERRYCTLDIETFTPTGEPNPALDELRIVGLRSSSGTIKYYLNTNVDLWLLQQHIDAFPYVVGHNLKEYDIPILQRYGITFRHNVIIDTYEICKKRLKPMMYIDLNQGGYSLASLCTLFNLPVKKGEFDYARLREEIRSFDAVPSGLLDYLDGDLIAADSLFSYLYNFFVGFSELVSEKDKRRMSWLTSSAGTIAYKIICHQAGLPEEYDDTVEDTDEVQYAGAYVSTPTTDFVEGDIYCFDFNSLYPHMFIGGNLYSPVPKGEGWNGSGLYPSAYVNDEDGIIGTYSRELGKIERLLLQMFQERKNIKAKQKSLDKSDPEYTRLDAMQLAYKICINTAYGISGNPRFKSVYSLTTAADCTAMGRRSIKYARRYFTDAGYVVLYSDTDSLYILDTFRDQSMVRRTADDVSSALRESFNVGVCSHSLAFESSIKRMYFMRDDSGEFIKKHYIYVKDDGEVVLKGLQIKKGNCSPAARAVFDKYILPHIKAGQPVIMPYEYIASCMRNELKENPHLFAKRYRTWPVETYKSESPIQAQISKRYGAGEHWMIVNTRIGVGKGNRYAKLEELQEKYGDEWVDYVKLNTYISDLKEFIVVEERKLVK